MTVKADSAEAVASKRSVAASPATPNEVRWVMATRYAKTPAPQTSQARVPFTATGAGAGPRPPGPLPAGSGTGPALRAGIPARQVRFDGGTQFIGAGQFVIVPGQQGPAGHAIGMLVVLLLQVGDDGGNLGGALDLLGDLALHGAAGLAQAFAGQHERRGGTQEFKACDGGGRVLGVGQVVRDVDGVADHVAARLGQLQLQQVPDGGRDVHGGLP